MFRDKLYASRFQEAGLEDVRLEQFTGPLDLLLQLVRQARLDITEIALAQVSQQYFERIEAMQRLDMEIESSYLLVFAQLLELKSRMLLPDFEEPLMQGELEFEEFLSDAPREDAPLVEKLAAYAMVRQASDWLEERQKEAGASYVRQVRPVYGGPPVLDVSLSRLAGAMRRICLRELLAKPVTLTKVQLSVPERITQLWNYLSHRTRAWWKELLGEEPTRPLIIVTFLALLQMSHDAKVSLRQIVDEADDSGHVENGAVCGAEDQSAPREGRMSRARMLLRQAALEGLIRVRPGDIEITLVKASDKHEQLLLNDL